MRGKRVALRTTSADDLTDHLRWHADPELTKWMAERPRPGSLEQRKEWLKEMAKDRGAIHWEIARDDAHVGYCSIRLVWPPMAKAWWIHSFFLAPQARGQGLGREAARALHRYLVDYLGLEFGDVWLYRDDAAGRGLSAALGYAEYSHGHEVFYREGRWWDDWRAILRAEDFRSRFPEEIEYAETEPG